MSEVQIRTATIDDAEDILNVYRYYVEMCYTTQV